MKQLLTAAENKENYTPLAYDHMIYWTTPLLLLF